MATSLATSRKRSHSQPVPNGIEMKQRNLSTPALPSLHDDRDELEMELQRAVATSRMAGRSDLPPFNDRNISDVELLNASVPKPRRKSFGFMMAFLALAIVAFVSTLDATTLSVALPVRTVRAVYPPITWIHADVTYALGRSSQKTYMRPLSNLSGRGYHFC